MDIHAHGEEVVQALGRRLGYRRAEVLRLVGCEHYHLTYMERGLGIAPTIYKGRGMGHPSLYSALDIVVLRFARMVGPDRRVGERYPWWLAEAIGLLRQREPEGLAGRVLVVGESCRLITLGEFAATYLSLRGPVTVVPCDQLLRGLVDPDLLEERAS